MTTTFTLPDDAEATAPPEWQGLERDEVRLMEVRPAPPTSFSTCRATNSASSYSL